jgi:deoxyribodipyrimidine photolyase
MFVVLYRTVGLPPISSYKESRMMAGGVDNSAKLSAYLACGCLSPRTIHAAALAADAAQGLEPGSGPGETLIMHLMIR